MTTWTTIVVALVVGLLIGVAIPVGIMVSPLVALSAGRRNAVRRGLPTIVIALLVCAATVASTWTWLDEPANPGNNYSPAQVAAFCLAGVTILVVSVMLARYPERAAVAASVTLTYTAAVTWIIVQGREDTSGLYGVGVLMAVYPAAMVTTLISQTVAAIRVWAQPAEVAH